MIGYDEFSEVLVSVSYDMRGNPERYDFEWRGKSPKVRISKHLLEDCDPAVIKNPMSDVISFGPYRLRLVENEVWQMTNVYIREDYPLWRVVVWRHKACRLLDLFYRRLIITWSKR